MNVIEVRDLGKRYRIGRQEKRHDTLVGQIGGILRAPIDNFRRLRDLSRFGDKDESVFWALKDINFDVQQGDVLGIIGHNGAGKSTLLKILAHITEPTRGEVRIKGRISALLEVGAGFHGELTGRENIYMNGTILGMTKKEIDRKLDEIVDFSGVEQYIDTPIKFYSSGMKVRLGFAVAAHLEPEILIIDEVLAVGDAEFQRKCLGKMEIVAGEGRTILFVSHDMKAIRSLCHKAFVLKNGLLDFIGLAADAVSAYLKDYTDIRHSLTYTPEQAPGNLEAKLLHAAVQPLPECSWPLREGDGFRLLFEFLYTGEDHAALHVTFHLVDENDNVVFVGSNDVYEQPAFYNKGSISLVCDVPAGIMHHGNFRVAKLSMFRSGYYPLLKLHNSISFDLLPLYDYDIGLMGQKEGVINPKLHWSATYQPI